MKNCFSLGVNALVFSACALCVTLAAAQSAGIPKKLVGNWTTVDGRATGAMEVIMDSASGKAALNVQSSIGVCTIKDAPATVVIEGEKLLVRVDPAWSNYCRKDVSIELTNKAGTQDYDGELRQGGRAKESNPILRVKLSP